MDFLRTILQIRIYWRIFASRNSSCSVFTMSTMQAPMPTTDQAAAAAAAVSAPAAAVAIGKPKISTCKDLKTASISNKPKFTYKDANDKELACVHVSFSPHVPLPEGAKILSYSIKLKCTSGQNKVLQTKTLTAHPVSFEHRLRIALYVVVCVPIRMMFSPYIYTGGRDCARA